MTEYHEFDEDPPMMDVLDGELVHWWQDNTAEGGGRWVASPDFIDGETHEERIARFDMLRQRSLTPEGRAHSQRVDRTIEASRWLDAHSDEPPCLRLRCSAESGAGKACRTMIASVWKTPAGYLFWGMTYPFVEANIEHLASAMELRSDGNPFHAAIADTQMAMVGTPLPVKCLLSNPSVSMPAEWFTDGEQRLLVGCRHHGNVAVPISALLEAARSNSRSGKLRRDMDVNPQNGPVL